MQALGDGLVGYLFGHEDLIAHGVLDKAGGIGQVGDLGVEFQVAGGVQIVEVTDTQSGELHGGEVVGGVLTLDGDEVDFELKGNTMLVLPGRDETIVRAANNIEKLQTSYVNTLNVYDILKAGKIILTQDALKGVEEVYA